MGYRAPSFKELLLFFENPAANYVVAGNPGLKPERSIGAGVGLLIRPLPGLLFQVDGFRNELTDMISVQSLPQTSSYAQFSYVNVGEAVTEGLSAELKAQPIPFVELRGGYDLTSTRDKTSGLELEGRPRHRGTFGVALNQSLWGLRLSVNCEFVGPRTFYEYNEAGETSATQSVPYALLNARVAKSLSKHIEFFFGVENLLLAEADERPVLVGTSNADTAGPLSQFPSSPWRLYGGLRLRYSAPQKDQS